MKNMNRIPLSIRLAVTIGWLLGTLVGLATAAGMIAVIMWIVKTVWNS